MLHLAHDISCHIHSQELLLLALPLVLLATGMFKARREGLVLTS